MSRIDKKAVTIRWILTIALIYGVYVETGAWTTLFALLVFLRAELIDLVLRRHELIK